MQQAATYVGIDVAKLIARRGRASDGRALAG